MSRLSASQPAVPAVVEGAPRRSGAVDNPAAPRQVISDFLRSPEASQADAAVPAAVLVAMRELAAQEPEGEMLAHLRFVLTQRLEQMHRSQRESVDNGGAEAFNPAQLLKRRKSGLSRLLSRGEDETPIVGALADLEKQTLDVRKKSRRHRLHAYLRAAWRGEEREGLMHQRVSQRRIDKVKEQARLYGQAHPELAQVLAAYGGRETNRQVSAWLQAEYEFLRPDEKRPEAREALQALTLAVVDGWLAGVRIHEDGTDRFAVLLDGHMHGVYDQEVGEKRSAFDALAGRTIASRADAERLRNDLETWSADWQDLNDRRSNDPRFLVRPVELEGCAVDAVLARVEVVEGTHDALSNLEGRTQGASESAHCLTILAEIATLKDTVEKSVLTEPEREALLPAVAAVEEVAEAKRQALVAAEEARRVEAERLAAEKHGKKSKPQAKAKRPAPASEPKPMPKLPRSVASAKDFEVKATDGAFLLRGEADAAADLLAFAGKKPVDVRLRRLAAKEGGLLLRVDSVTKKYKNRFNAPQEKIKDLYRMPEPNSIRDDAALAKVVAALPKPFRRYIQTGGDAALTFVRYGELYGALSHGLAVDTAQEQKRAARRLASKPMGGGEVSGVVNGALPADVIRELEGVEKRTGLSLLAEGLPLVPDCLRDGEPIMVLEEEDEAAVHAFSTQRDGTGGWLRMVAAVDSDEGARWVLEQCADASGRVGAVQKRWPVIDVRQRSAYVLHDKLFRLERDKDVQERYAQVPGLAPMLTLAQAITRPGHPQTGSEAGDRVVAEARAIGAAMRGLNKAFDVALAGQADPEVLLKGRENDALGAQVAHVESFLTDTVEEVTSAVLRAQYAALEDGRPGTPLVPAVEGLAKDLGISASEAGRLLAACMGEARESIVVAARERFRNPALQAIVRQQKRRTQPVLQTFEGQDAVPEFVIEGERNFVQRAVLMGMDLLGVGATAFWQGVPDYKLEPIRHIKGYQKSPWELTRVNAFLTAQTAPVDGRVVDEIRAYRAAFNATLETLKDYDPEKDREALQANWNALYAADGVLARRTADLVWEQLRADIQLDDVRDEGWRESIEKMLRWETELQIRHLMGETAGALRAVQRDG